MSKNNLNESSHIKNVKLTNDRNQLLCSWAALPAVTRSDPESQWFPPLDITKTPEDYLVEVDLPGLNPTDIQVTADAEVGILSLKGVRAPHLRGGRNMRVERPSGPFIRRIALPDDAQFGAMTTFFHNGVMELRVPRALRSQASPEGLEFA